MSAQAPMGMAQQPSSAPAEKSALTKVMWFGIFQLVGIVVGWVISFYTFTTAFIKAASLNLPPNPTPSQVGAALGPLFQEITWLIPITAAIELAGLVVLTMGFREFRKVDSSDFALPSNLMLLMIVGVVVAMAGVIPLFNELPAMIAQAPYAPGTTPSAAFASAIGAVLLFALISGLGGLLALIGVVGGMILGVWRIGSRYNEVIFKIGAIFVIIPLLNVVAPVLIIVAASQAKGRLSGRM